MDPPHLLIYVNPITLLNLLFSFVIAFYFYSFIPFLTISTNDMTVDTIDPGLLIDISGLLLNTNVQFSIQLNDIS